MNDVKNKYDNLIRIESLDGLTTDDALLIIAKLTDLSNDLKNSEGIEKSIRLNVEIQGRDLTLKQAALSHYYLANAYAIKSHLEGTDKDWKWEHEELENEIFNLRRSLQIGGHSLPDEYICPIMTNLANCLNKIGRFIEAIEYWDKVLEIDPDFSMALGNRGIGYVYYSRSLYDQGQALLFLKYAYPGLESACRMETLHRDAKVSFKNYIDWIRSVFKPGELEKEFNVESYTLGRSNAEREYRKWCLKNRLFLNPLNDIGPFPIAAHDVLCVPSIVVGIGEGPYYAAFYNQIKQEFTSARYLYYDATISERSHFSDKGVLLMDTMDYPSYSLAVEKMKAAYRMAYSIFDKIAFILNHYLVLFITEHRVSFKSIWYKSQKRNKNLRKEFRNLDNWPLRGLFWLSKDLFEDKSGFRDTIEPEASELNKIRNCLEHKYLKLHESMWQNPTTVKDKVSKAFTDTIAYSMYRDDFQRKTLRLLKMARSALIYLSLGIEAEERRKASKIGKNVYVPSMYLNTLEDKWKV